MTNKDLKTLIRLLRANGVTTYRTPELELVLDANIREKRQKVSLSANDDKIETDIVPDESTLYWSSAGIPEGLQE